MRKAHELRKLRKNSFRKYSFYYIIKQDIHIYVPFGRPNGWTEYAEFFVDTHGCPGVFIG